MTSAGESRSINVATVIDESPIGLLHWRVYILCAACLVMDGFDLQALGYVAPALVQDWKIAPQMLGPVFGATNFGILVGQLVFTMVADKVGRRPILIIGAIWFAILTMLTGLSRNIT